MGANYPYEKPEAGRAIENYLYQIASFNYVMAGFAPAGDVPANSNGDTVPIVVGGGAAYTTFPNAEAKSVALVNATGVTLLLRRQGVGYVGASSGEIVYPTGTVLVLPCQSNAAEWGVKRQDSSATAVTAGAVYAK